MKSKTTKTRAKVDKNRRHKKEAFLAAVSEVGNITRAAELAKVDRHSHYLWLKTDPDYPDLFEAAMDEACDRLETEARRRAAEGNLRTVFHGGKKVGTVREYSDVLLIFLLKGARPWKYKDRVAEVKVEQEVSAVNLNVEEIEEKLQRRLDVLHRSRGSLAGGNGRN